MFAYFCQRYDEMRSCARKICTRIRSRPANMYARFLRALPYKPTRRRWSRSWNDEIEMDLICTMCDRQSYSSMLIVVPVLRDRVTDLVWFGFVSFLPGEGAARCWFSKFISAKETDRPPCPPAPSFLNAWILNTAVVPPLIPSCIREYWTLNTSTYFRVKREYGPKCCCKVSFADLFLA